MSNDFKMPRRIFDLYWGASGAGKSRAIAQMIREMHKVEGKKARVVIGDGSMASFDALIDKGVVDAVEFAHRPWPTDIVQRLSEGHFPIDGDPLGPLVPPNQQKDIKDVGMYVFEGASVMGAYIMGSIKGGLAEQAGRGVQFGQDAPFRIINGEFDNSGKLIPGSGPGTAVGGNSQSHYMIGQNGVLNAVQRSKGLAPYVLWTAHEAINDPEKDKFIKELTVGPEVVGKKWISGFQKMFNASLHFQSVAKRTREKDEHTERDRQDLDIDYRIWVRDHFSPDQNTTVRFKAVVRGDDDGDLKDYYPSIKDFYTALREVQQKSLDS